MGDLWLGRSVELADRILNDAIRIRYALVLAKVLKPGRDRKRLQEAPFLGRVFENVPGVRAVPNVAVGERKAGITLSACVDLERCRPDQPLECA